jgi:bifunctional UDP-N-acetylglucosamine pyrophosphorylase / glucosamine-1-phosphate N-acetyltransferase
MTRLLLATEDAIANARGGGKGEPRAGSLCADDFDRLWPTAYNPPTLNTQQPVGAIVLAAGLGTRMQSAQAKVLHHLGGQPLIHYPLAALRRIGADPIVVVVGYQADAVREACAPFGVRFALQAEQKGTGHAALMAQSALADFDGDLVLVYGDLPFLRAETFQRLVAAHHTAHASVSLLTDIIADPAGFGRIVRDELGHVAGIVEDRDASAIQRAIREVNVGVYCVDAEFLFRALQQLQPTNVQGELYLTDIIGLARAQGVRIADAAATFGEGAQISSRADLAARETTLRENINNRWMAEGVTLEDPATAYIGPDVVIGRDTVIGPNVILRGATRIGEGCRFDGTALVTDAAIGRNVHIKLGVVITQAVIDDDVQVGPFAQLRPGTRLAARVHIGDFVETKNAVIGAGSKAMHHAYLGDAEIGADANIGCGTITCNYDGFRKHRTVIGDRVQIGSDSQLVAPVTIGDDAYVATGTTVRKDVAPGALVFNSKTERQRAGWVAAWRARERIEGTVEPKTSSRRSTSKTTTAMTANKPPSRRRAPRRGAVRHKRR